MVKDLSNYYKLNRYEIIQEGDIWIQKGDSFSEYINSNFFNKTMNENNFRNDVDVDVYRENPKFKWSLGLKILN